MRNIRKVDEILEKEEENNDKTSDYLNCCQKTT